MDPKLISPHRVSAETGRDKNCLHAAAFYRHIKKNWLKLSITFNFINSFQDIIVYFYY